MARSWGFLGGRFAGTDLPPSAVHALIEIDRGRGRLSAKTLGGCLQLEKSSISRLLRKLVAVGDVREEADPLDGRIKWLSLTEAGAQRVAAIHAHARAQVAAALARLAPEEGQAVLKGLRLYDAALGATGPGVTGVPATQPIEILPGHQVGLIARITQLHAEHYARHWGLGMPFEAKVAAGLAEFCPRLGRPGNQIWAAMQGGRIVGSVAIDGEDLGPGRAHLRWFILDDAARGTGAGRRLLSSALDFVDRQNVTQTQLWTFSGLDAARHLYESAGFELAEEWPGTQWGSAVLEQRFVRPRPGAAVPA